MIDVAYYVNRHLNKESSDIFLKYFSHYKFDNLYSFRNFLSKIDNSNSKYLERVHVSLKGIVAQMAQYLSRAIAANDEMPIKEVIARINATIKPAEFFVELEAQDLQKSCICPSCGKRRASIHSYNDTYFITCNRKNNCAYNENILSYYKSTRNGTIFDLAKELNIDTEEGEVHIGGKPIIRPRVSFVPKVAEVKKIEYIEFDKNIQYSHVKNISEYNTKLNGISDQDLLRFVYETLFRFIKNDKNKKGEKRRTPMWNYLLNKRAFDIDNRLIGDIGFLHLSEAPLVLKALLKIFSVEQLVKTNILKEVEEDKIVSFVSRKLLDEAIELAKTKVTAKQLVDEGILKPLNSDNPFTLDFKNNATLKLIKLISREFGSDSLEDFMFTIKSGSIYRFGFDFLFNEYEEKSGLIFLRSKNLYTGLAEEFRIRPTHIKKGLERFKEIQQSCDSITKALPFGLSYETLTNANILFATEGPMDLIALGNTIEFRNSVFNVYGFGIPGVNRVVKEQLGLLRGKTVLICFDADKAGRDGAEKFKTMLVEAEVSCRICTWSSSLVYSNQGSLKLLSTLANNKTKVMSIKWIKPCFKDLNEVKKAIKNDENGNLPFKSMGEFFDKFVVISK